MTGTRTLFVAANTSLYYVRNDRTAFVSALYKTTTPPISIIGCGDFDKDGTLTYSWVRPPFLSR